ncbi:MAG: DUF935 domain-containing protein [Mesorhizobium amorphae]|nr:MAG: DUF935 domain-containing protein [Mesorhizobium amorphae]
MAVTLLDAYGRPIDRQALRQEQASPTTAGIRRHDAMHPAAGLTPGRLARLLRNSIENDAEQYLALAEDMEERDQHYGSVLATRKLQVAGLDITVEAATDDKAGIAHADLVREIIERDAFQFELIDILDAIGKGFSATEILWDTSEGQWRPRALKRREPRWFEFDRIDGETLLLREPGGPVPLQPFGWIVHEGKAKSGLPIRGGLARGAAWTFLFKAFTVRDWAIFCEAYGQPLRLGKYDAGASERDKEVLLEAVTNIGTDYAAIVPVSMAVEFVGAQLAGNHELYEKRADWLDRQTSKSVLGQTATTDAIAGGHAVGKTHDRVRDDIEKADARQLAATLRRDLVRALVDLNFGPQKAYPRLKIGRPEEEDVEKLVRNVVQLVPFGLRVSTAVMRDKLGLPDPDAREEVLGKPAPAPAPVLPTPVPPAPGDKPAQTSFSATTGAGNRDAIDRGIDLAIGDWEPLLAPLTVGLSDRLAAATTIEEATAILAEQFAGMDVAALTEQLARAAFAARIAGEAEEPLA